MALDFTKINAEMTSLQNQMAAAISTIQADAADKAELATAQAQIAQDATDAQAAQGQIDALTQQIATLQAAIAAAGVPIP
jgi:uncharacterized protein (DUF3084 family)